MSQRNHQKSQKVDAGSPPLTEKDKMNQGLKAKLDEALKKNKEILHEKEEQKDMQRKLKDMETQCRVLKARLDKTLDTNKQLHQEKEQENERQKEMESKLQTTEDQQTNNKRRQPDIKIINEGWRILFGKARERIMYLMSENKKKRAKLEKMSNHLQGRETVIKEMQWDLCQMDMKNEELQQVLGEALERNDTVPLP